MFDYVVVKVGFSIDGREYNVGDRVTGNDARVIDADDHLQKRCVRVKAQAAAPVVAPPAADASKDASKS
jgi:hypothetical protein